MSEILPFKISTLIFVRNASDHHLLIQRRKKPNLGRWSPIGGKLNFAAGESPYECARRETEEEIGIQLKDEDLHCFGYISEKSYEGAGHWLMFLFHCRRTIQTLPAAMDEGHFAFFKRSCIDTLNIPETDRTLIWPYYDRFKNTFIGVRADCAPGGALTVTEELRLPESE